MSAPSAPPPTAPVQDDAPDPFPETTVICLICFLVVVPLCFVWYRRKCDRNRDVCVFPTCICRFFAVHCWRIELTRDYRASHKEEHHKEAASVPA